MLTTGKLLKDKLASNELVIGLMATDHAWPHLVEICQKGELDYLIIDCEHGDFSDELVSSICQVGRLANFPVLVRTISSEPTVVRRKMDLGPCGILLPNVESTDELDQVQKAVWMPPRGCRRPGGKGNYWMRDFNYDTWKSEFEDHFIVIPQIESQVGVDAAPALAAHPLVTALGLGPYDLSADLGCCWDPENGDFQAAMATVKVAADGEGKKVWAGCDGPALRRKGYTFLWIGTPSSTLTSALSRMVDEIKNPEVELASEESGPPPA
jgi:2-keto-3-deoxy-L-rhamnonate aldolase RhmA